MTRTVDALVIFGITGDLAQKMTFPALYRLERRGLLDCPVVGVAGSELTTAQLADRARTQGRSPRSAFTAASQDPWHQAARHPRLVHVPDVPRVTDADIQPQGARTDGLDGSAVPPARGWSRSASCKCQLKEPSTEDYEVSWTSAQWERLESIFSSGACVPTPSLAWRSRTRSAPGSASERPPAMWVTNAVRPAARAGRTPARARAGTRHR